MTNYSATKQLQDLMDYCRDLDESTTESSSLRMDCLCLIASGEDNTLETLGHDASYTEEGARFTLRSIEDIITDASPEVQAVFRSQGFKW
jgi:hypothetical protein